MMKIYGPRDNKLIKTDSLFAVVDITLQLFVTLRKSVPSFRNSPNFSNKSICSDKPSKIDETRHPSYEKYL
jgi:hypothetical protein